MTICGMERVAKEIVTDTRGNILYSADEYKGLYGNARQTADGTDNPYHSGDVMNWEKGYAEMVKEISWSGAEKREKDLDIITREADR